MGKYFFITNNYNFSKKIVRKLNKSYIRLSNCIIQFEIDSNLIYLYYTVNSVLFLTYFENIFNLQLVFDKIFVIIKYDEYYFNKFINKLAFSKLIKKTSDLIIFTTPELIDENQIDYDCMYNTCCYYFCCFCFSSYSIMIFPYHSGNCIRITDNLIDSFDLNYFINYFAKNSSNLIEFYQMLDINTSTLNELTPLIINSNNN